MITTKIGQIENTIKLQKDSLKRNTLQNAQVYKQKYTRG